ncbi:ribose-5-phosphate isomerase A [Candidatus Woesearchaeota archaeon]|nr:ribose-5-phosphate isomerase A [Candidatus Woesearchaeota archaeon]
MTVSQEMQWELAAEAALDSIKDYVSENAIDTIVLGTGRTVKKTLELLLEDSELAALNIVCGTDGLLEYANELTEGTGRVIGDKDSISGDYIYIDGADQIDPKGNLLKGGIKVVKDKDGKLVYICFGDPGFEGATRKEKDLARGAKYFMVVADSSKEVPYLGANGYKLPIEFDYFHKDWVLLYLNTFFNLKADLASDLRRVTEGEKAGSIFLTENVKVMLDVDFDGKRYIQTDLELLERLMEDTYYIHSAGLFAETKPNLVIIADSEGHVRKNYYPEPSK